MTGWKTKDFTLLRLPGGGVHRSPAAWRWQAGGACDRASSKTTRLPTTTRSIRRWWATGANAAILGGVRPSLVKVPLPYWDVSFGKSFWQHIFSNALYFVSQSWVTSNQWCNPFAHDNHVSDSDVSLICAIFGIVCALSSGAWCNIVWSRVTYVDLSYRGKVYVGRRINTRPYRAALRCRIWPATIKLCTCVNICLLHARRHY